MPYFRMAFTLVYLKASLYWRVWISSYAALSCERQVGSVKLGIMQPYFFPYLGYWQLMNAVDCYVVYDDVQYITRGYINRNAILINGQPHNINLIVSGASQNKLIKDIKGRNEPKEQAKLLRTISLAYARAPYYPQVMPLVEAVVAQNEADLVKYLCHSFRIVGAYLGIKTELLLSSALAKDASLRAYKKILALCQLLGATAYYNPCSGRSLYEPHRDEFAAAGIDLRFLQMRELCYPQFKNQFVPNLSIIDVMMFNSQAECRRLLGEYQLIS